MKLLQKWIEEHKSDYRGNRTGDLTDAYIAKIKEDAPHFTGMFFDLVFCFNNCSDSLREQFIN